MDQAFDNASYNGNAKFSKFRQEILEIPKIVQSVKFSRDSASLDLLTVE